MRHGGVLEYVEDVAVGDKISRKLEGLAGVEDAYATADCRPSCRAIHGLGAC